MLSGDVANCERCGELDPLSGRWVHTSENPFGSWTCENCPNNGGTVHPYATRILELFLLQKGGYPFEADDLDISDRLLLGAVEMSLQRRRITEVIESILCNNE